MLSFDQFRACVQAAVPELGTRWLNRHQEAAVQAAPFPPVFIVAGPGTGKTTVLALRLLKLVLVDGYRPEGVVATTFTRKAAAELRSRILSWGYGAVEKANRMFAGANPAIRKWLSNLDINRVRTGTLDSLAEEMLREDRQPGDITPAVVDSFMSRGLLRRNVMFVGGRHRSAVLENHLRQFNPDYPGVKQFAEKLKVCQRFAERVLHDGIDLARYKVCGNGYRELAEIVGDYLDCLRGRYLVDFALLENELLVRLRNGQLTRTIEGLQALLVDEFQDTNYLQEQIYYELCRRAGAALTVVGDDDQSIYRFRGATVEIFANLTNRITHHLGDEWQPVRYDLVDNYRATAKIIMLCNHFIAADQDYQKSRVPGKQPLVPAAAWATDPQCNIPVLGLFRDNVHDLAEDLCQLLLNVFRRDGHRVEANKGTFVLQRAPDGDFGDAVYLAWKVQEYRNNGNLRLPGLIRNQLAQDGVNVFNPRGRSLAGIPEVAFLLGLMLECIDPDARVQDSINTLRRDAFQRMHAWRDAAWQFAKGDPPPGGLASFLKDWAARRPGHGGTWPEEWPLLELLYTLVTWLPRFQRDPEGQVYLETIARTIAQAAQIGTYGSRLIFNDVGHHRASVHEAIREVFEAIAEENVEVNEEIMPYVPRSYFPLMTVHQAKGLEFPLVVVDVGSDFSTNHWTQAPFRYPRDGNNTHFTEDHVADFTRVGPERLVRNRQQRAFDDLRRLYYVAMSRAQNALILVGLTSLIRLANPVRSVGVGDCSDGQRRFLFVSAREWSPEAPAKTIALI